MAEKRYLDYDGLALYDSTLKSDATPAANGTAAAGTSKKVSRADHVHPTDTSRAPTSHASSATTYGKGTSSNYGHVKLSDATNGTAAAASGGTAATPKAVADALTAAKAYADGKADQNTTYGLSISGHTISLVESGDTASVTVPDNNTTYSLSGSLSSHKFTSTLTPSSGTSTTSDFTLAAGTGITITDDATNRKMTIATTAEANQNAFSNVKVGSTTIAADAKQDTIELVAGSNVTLTPDATNDKVTIAATDTTYSDFTGATASAAGTHGLVPAQAKIPSGSSAYQFTLRGSGDWKRELIVTTQHANGLAIQKGYVNESGSTTDPVADDIDSIIPLASTSGNGVMSADDKTKLNGIAAGAEVNQNAFSNVKVGSTTVAADAKTDTLELVAGSNVTLTPDATNDKITIAATDTNTKYGLSISGHTVSLVEGGTTSSVTVPDNDTTALGSMTGTLGVNHGGTGVNTLGAGVVYHSASGTGALSIASAANLVSAIGNSAVNRATADASGNNIADTYAKKSDIASMYKYKGSVATESALPSTGVTTGDVYNIEAESSYGPAGSNVAWNGTEWDSLGGLFTITSITNAEINALFA